MDKLQSYIEQAKMRADIICHELIHTLIDCRNHGSEFQYWCSVFNDKFNMNMSTRYSLEEQSVAFQRARKEISAKRNRKKYSITCKNCGGKIKLEEL